MSRETLEQARLKGYILGALRQVYRYHKAKNKALDAAVVKSQDLPYVDKRGAKRTRKLHFYECGNCGTVRKRDGVQVDHRNPVVPLSGFVDWNTHIERLFCSASDLWVLCKDCHNTKTKEENAERRKYRAKKKKEDE